MYGATRRPSTPCDLAMSTSSPENGLHSVVICNLVCFAVFVGVAERLDGARCNIDELRDPAKLDLCNTSVSRPNYKEQYKFSSIERHFL